MNFINQKMEELANFSVENVQTNINNLLELSTKITNEEIEKNNISWESILKIEEIDEKISQYTSLVSHFNAVCNTKELRKAYEYLSEKLTKHYTKQGQNKDLYNLYKNVSLRKDLSQEQKQTLKKSLLSFQRSGVDLPKEKREQIEKLKKELSLLSNKFENNILDAIMDYNFETSDKNILAGISENIIETAKQKAKQLKSKEEFSFGIDIPTYIAIMQQAESRELREIFYKAFTSKSSSFADNQKYNNDSNIEKILQKRLEIVNLLGFDNYAEYSLQVKMAESPNQVLDLLNDLLNKSISQAQDELNELKEFANIDELKPWDVTYFSEKLKKEKFNFTEEELRKYFPVEKVLNGLFEILNKIYGLETKELKNIPKYIDEQRIFEFSLNNKTVGAITCDFFARENKRGGAWMDSVTTRYKNLNNEIQLPIAFVNCNFMPQINGIDGFTHTEVVTLFHEFGHALHHILSNVDVSAVSGVNGVEWDAVELPSQFMENFCWNKETITLISGTKDGQELSNDNLSKLEAVRHYHSALMMLRQLEFGIFDMMIHLHKKISVESVQNQLDEIRLKTSLIKAPKYNKFQNGFSHIFAGGYAAGYYSYKWAEILSSDAFSIFEKTGVLSKETGIKFLKEIISKGSSRDAMDNFKSFTGREPSTDALLRHSGIKC